MTTKVEFTNRSKPALYLKDNTYNYQTCITMAGVGVDEYVGINWTNILRMMEHYSNSEPPSPAFEGQLWYDTSNKELKVNIGRYLGEPEWVAISGKSIPTTSSLLSNMGGALPNDLYVNDSPKYITNVVSREYADKANVVAFNGVNNNYQYNITDFNGMITLNGTIKQYNFYNSVCVVKLPFVMRDINYTITLSCSSNTEYLPSGDNTPTGHHYYISDKHLSSFKVVTDSNLPSGSEIDFCLVGFVQ